MEVSLYVQNKNADKAFKLSVETPFLALEIINATVLPGDEVVFQAGNQVCIFDRESRKLGVLARGRGPVVVLED